MEVQEYTGKEDLTKGKVFLKFGAEWCGPCRMSKSMIRHLANEYEDVTFIDVDVDKFQELSTKYKLRIVPTVFGLKDGEIIGQVPGVNELEYIELISKLV